MKSTSHYILGWRQESRDDVIIHLIYYFALELYILIVRISRIVKRLYLQRQPTFEYHRQYFSIRYTWTLLHTYDNRPLFMTGIHGPIWSDLIQDFKIFWSWSGSHIFAGPGPGTLTIFRSRSGTVWSKTDMCWSFDLWYVRIENLLKTERKSENSSLGGKTSVLGSVGRLFILVLSLSNLSDRSDESILK